MAILTRGILLRGLACLRGAGVCLHRSRRLSTLNPAHLVSSDFMILSWKTAHVVRAKGLEVRYCRSGVSNHQHLPFPSGTQGFYYFVPGPIHAPIAGEIRFRITSDSSPAAFAGGCDLLLPEIPQPWRIPLPNVVQNTRTHQHFYDLLVERDRAISAELVRLVRQAKIPRLRPSRSHIIHSLEQPFLVDVAESNQALWIASGSAGLHAVRLIMPGDYRDETCRTPYKGLIKCHFEAADHEGQQALVLRVLEIVIPVTPKHADYRNDGHLPIPVAGELFKTHNDKVWYIFMDEAVDSTRGLRALLPDSPQGKPAHSSLRPSKSTRTRERGARSRCIHNLAPSELAPYDWTDLSLSSGTYVRVLDSPSGIRGRIEKVGYGRADSTRSPFPEGTAGFFYIHVPDPAHPIGAQVRFRLVPKPDPAGFAAGQDLRTASGDIWWWWLPALIRGSAGKALGHIAVRQGLVDRTAVDAWLDKDNVLPRIRSYRLLTYPGSERFPWDLTATSPHILMGYGAHVKKVKIVSPFFPVTGFMLGTTGELLLALEEDLAQERFSLRVVKIVGLQLPPGYQGEVTWPMPEEGALYRLGSGRRLWRLFQELRKKGELSVPNRAS